MGALQRALKVFARDREAGLTVGALARKSARYALELATAPWYLQGVNEVSAGVRTLGRPRIDNQGFIHLGANVLLRSVNVPVELGVGPGARLVIGDDCSINYGVSIGVMREVRLGRRCRLGPYSMVIDSDFHDVYDRSKRPEPKPVTLEDDVWVGAKASIMPGVTVGRGSIVGTGAVVTQDVPPWTVVGGVPAKVLRSLDPEKFVSP